MLGNTRNAKTLILWLAVSVILACAVLLKLQQQPIKFNADILDVMEISQHDRIVTAAATQPFYHRALLLFSSPNNTLTEDYLRRVQHLLADIPLVKQVYFNPQQNMDFQAIAKTYSAFPLSLLSDKALAARQRNNVEYIDQQYIRMLSQLADPLVSMTIQNAPLLNVADWLADKHPTSHWLQQGDFLYVKDGGKRYYPIFFEFDAAATKLDQAPPTIAAIQQVLQQQNTEDNVEYLSSGLIFHTAAITSRAEFEMTLFGGLSILGIVLLTLLSFKSIWPLANILLLTASSAAAGMAVLILVSNEIHLITLVFAISLIGIAVDYGYHILLMARHTQKQGSALSKHIAPALIVGGGSTLLSYLLLYALPIAFLQQVSIFVGSGVLFAIFTCLTLLSIWPGTIKNPPLKEPKITQLPAWSYKLTLYTVVIIIAVALMQWRFEDNIKSFNSTPQSLIDSETHIARLIGNQQYPRFISFSAENTQQLLQRFESVRSALIDLGYQNAQLQGIDQWLPSHARQQANADWLKQGLVNNDFKTINAYTAPMVIDTLIKQPTTLLSLDAVPDVIAQHYPAIVHLDERDYGILSYLGVISPDTVALLQKQLSFPVQLLDQPQKLTQAMLMLRQYILYFLGLATCAISLLMICRYGFLRGLKVALTPVLSALGGLALAHLIMGFVTIFHLLASILILTLVVDYVVFCQEHGKVHHVNKAINLSAITTALGFGMFVFSATPAIQQFGLTALLGITLGWIMCATLPTTITKNKG
ncbi:MMPL family transporter [Alteromonadaceae bacterium BrNp21-10]|nr:MMPL family transporter [Alteromonadaceae bacterium BrNp21-10]